jgi:cytochrome c oxidase cbb3-type subunit 3
VNYVMSLSDEPADPTRVEAGSVIFADNCASCHGEDAKGGREVGAPNLTDAVWLYGGDYATLVTTVQRARFGVMPPWAPRLTPAEISAVATYVHQLGGGE